MQRFWKALTTWLMLADTLESSLLARKLALHARGELLLEKLRCMNSQRLRRLPCGFVVRRNRADMNVLISMPTEYGLLERNFAGQTLTVVDAGANIGAFAMYLRSFSTLRCYVGIEAAPANYAILEKNVRIFGPEYSAIRCVLTARPQTVGFCLTGDPSRLGVSESGAQTEGLPLDDLAPIKELPVIDILKVDVEGSELEVLSGAQQTLAKARYIVMEIHQSVIGAEGVARLFTTMDRQRGHVIFGQSPDHRQMNCYFWRRYDAPLS